MLREGASGWCCSHVRQLSNISIAAWALFSLDCPSFFKLCLLENLHWKPALMGANFSSLPSGQSLWNNTLAFLQQSITYGNIQLPLLPKPNVEHIVKLLVVTNPHHFGHCLNPFLSSSSWMLPTLTNPFLCLLPLTLQFLGNLFHTSFDWSTTWKLCMHTKTNIVFR